MTDRPYQEAAVQSIIDHWKQEIMRQLVVLATGGGKTRIAARLPEAVGLRRSRKRMLCLVHRDELAWQAADTFRHLNPDMTVGIEKAQHWAGDADIVVGSVQTLSKNTDDGAGAFSKRLTQFNPDHFGLIVTDETHHAYISGSYRSIYRYMRCLKGMPDLDPSKLMIGITATPNRTDNIGAEALYDKIVYNYGMREMINDKWLTRIICHRVETEVDISKIHTTAGEFDKRELEQSINTPERNELVAREYLKIRKEDPENMGQSLFFTVDINHAHDLCEVLWKNSIKAYPISGKTPPSECARFLRLLSEGAIDGLASAGKLTEGVDLPRAMNAFMCRPILSRLLFEQCVGRVVRQFPSPEEVEAIRQSGKEPGWIKPFCRIIDFVDVSGRHSLVTTPSLFGVRGKFNPKGRDVLKQIEELEELAGQNPDIDIESCKDLDEARKRADLLKTKRITVDLLAAPIVPPEIREVSAMSWRRQSEDVYFLSMIGGQTLSIRGNALGTYSVYQHINGIATRIAGDIPLLAAAVKTAEARIPGAEMVVMKSDASWRREPPTEKQAYRMWMDSKDIRKQFKSSKELLAHFLKRHEAGDESCSRGGISRKIETLQMARLSQPAGVLYNSQNWRKPQ